MPDSQSIFLDFNLPTATTWFYLSSLLIVALFFKFTRLLCIRNLDLLTIPLLVPGLLLLRESDGENWFGYLWLAVGSAYLLFRCFLDLPLQTRPAIAPNLNLSGLAWLAVALFICLIAVAGRQPKVRADPNARTPVGINQVEQQVEKQAAKTGIDVKFWVARGLSLACHLAVVLGLIFTGGRHFQDWHSGMAAATFYLLLPYTAFDITQWHHVWPMALVVWAVFAYRIPTLSGALIGIAAATTYFPFALFFVWIGFYRGGRGLGRFAGAFWLVCGVCGAVVAYTLWLNHELAQSVQSGLSFRAWQPWLPPGGQEPGLWRGLHWAYRIPIFISYLAMLGVSTIWPSPKNLAHVLALSAAAIIGVQFLYSDQGGIYILWYLPLLLLLTFRPNLADRRPLPIQRETDWLTRLGRRLRRLVQRLIRGPAPLVRTP
jgi:hypothetical protein